MATGRLVVTIREGESVEVHKPDHVALIFCEEVNSRSGVWIRLTDGEVDIPEAFISIGSDLRSNGFTVTCLQARSRKARIAISAPKVWKVTRVNDRE